MLSEIVQTWDQSRQDVGQYGEGDVQQILGAWAGLDPRKRIMAIVTAVLVVATLVGMSRLASRPNLALLYAGLDASSAGQVVSALEQQGVVYQVRGDSIYVPMRDRDALRMTLAGEGLPSTGGRGYELLDGLSGFGTTSQMFDAAYWRAKEGELARTIVGSPHISQARVHIANGSSNPFQRSVQPTASISVVPTGGGLTSEQAQALRFLVASAVAGLDISDVAVIDANGKVIGSHGRNRGSIWLARPGRSPSGKGYALDRSPCRTRKRCGRGHGRYQYRN